MKRFTLFLIGTALSICCFGLPQQNQVMQTMNTTPTYLFDRYPWLDNKIDIANCENTKVIEYLAEGSSTLDNFVYIIKDETALLYSGWGFVVCEDANDGHCIGGYNLTTIGSEWQCGEIVCSILEICPSESTYLRLDPFFLEGQPNADCERSCSGVTKVDVSPADYATIDALTGIRFNPPSTTTYTVTYTIGNDFIAPGGDCAGTDVPCTVRTRTQQVCVIVKDCGRCDAPVAGEDLLNSINEEFLYAENGVVVMEHFGPETGYFYEVKNKCPYFTGSSYEDLNYNGYFFSCSGDLICFYGERFWGVGDLPYCASNLYQLDFSKATSSKIIYESDCDYQPTTFNICEGESVSLSYNTSGAAPDEAGKPITYDCSQPTVTIEQVGNPIQQENAFLVSPTTSTTYNIEVKHPNGTCPPRTYQYLVNVDTNCGQDLTADNLPNRFPWLSNVVDLNNCAETSIEVYQQSIFYYLLITTPTTTTLYFQDGTFYCQNANNFDCKGAYGFVNPIVTWTCDSGSFSANPSNFRFSNNQSENQFTVNPNPTTGRINLNLPVSKADFSTIRVFSALGKLVSVEKIKASNAITNLEMDLTNFDKGLYFIEYTTNKIATTKKVILK